MNAIASNPTQDPTSPSYVARPRRALYVDSQLTTPEAVQFVGRRLLDYAGTGKTWRTIVTPLTLVMDPNAPYQWRKRKLRPNDCIVIRSRMCVVKSCAPLASRDGSQLQHIEALEIDPDTYDPL